MQVAIIQVILLVLIALSLWLSLLVMRFQMAGRLFFLVQFVAGAIFVLKPEWLGDLAQLIGVGRGTDLLLYILIMVFYITGLCTIAKFRKIERTHTDIIRAMALQQAIDNTETAHRR